MWICPVEYMKEDDVDKSSGMNEGRLCGYVQWNARRKAMWTTG